MSAPGPGHNNTVQTLPNVATVKNEYQWKDNWSEPHNNLCKFKYLLNTTLIYIEHKAPGLWPQPPLSCASAHCLINTAMRCHACGPLYRLTHRIMRHTTILLNQEYDAIA